MLKKLFSFAIILAIMFICTVKVMAVEEANLIFISNSEITVNGEEISDDVEEDVYLTSSMDNGGESDEAKESNIEIENIININKSGTYEISGTLDDGQISVNANELDGDVTIILNDVDITCKNAPAIFVYNKENDSEYSVIIKTVKDTTNVISGGKIKQSVENWEDQEKILYYIEKDYDDSREYYERYKYDGVISSDISLIFEGEGTLEVNSLEKEGIESKRDITINSGNYIINSLDDGINACTDNESIITINDGTVLVNVQKDAEEGDGIDSNGSIHINGGNVYAFASETSQDNGLDADSGIYINGGYVVSTGNMAERIDSSSKQVYETLQLDKVQKETLVTLTDENDNPEVAFESDRAYSVLIVSTPDMKNGEHKIYEGGSIVGENENGLYTKITSYEKGTEKEYSSAENRMMKGGFERRDFANLELNYDIYFYLILALGIVLIAILAICLIWKKSNKALMLIIGILIGAILTTSGLFIYNKNYIEKQFTQVNQANRGIPDMNNSPQGDMPNGDRPDGEMPSGDENVPPQMP